MTRIILIRHGQTEWNRSERFRGHADVPLNETDLAQAEATALRVVAEWKPTWVYSSPLDRAVRTGEAIARRLGLRVQPHPGLTDLDFGQWQGLSPEEVRDHWPEKAQEWIEAPHRALIPGGESLPIARTRVMTAVREIVSRHTGGTFVLVGHDVVNRLVLLAAMGLGNERYWHIRQDNCAINVVETQKDDFTIVSLNDTCHLREFE